MKDAVRNLRTDKSIHILKADKGNATVVFDRVQDDNKILALLNTPTYRELWPCSCVVQSENFTINNMAKTAL